MERVGRMLILPCPECHDPEALHCQVSGSWDSFTVDLVTQICACDPFMSWEDVWEQARERVFEEGNVD